MGTLGGGNGGERSPEGGGAPEGLPGLPPEWGVVVVPDDPAALAEEAALVRRQLRRQSRVRRWRRRLGMPVGSPDASIALPLLIMAIAIIATLTSLFAVTWPRPHRTATPPSARPTLLLPDLTLVDAAGAPVRLRELGPAVLLLMDSCECGVLLAETVASAPVGVTVLPVGRTAPTVADLATTGPPPGTKRAAVRPLADPGETLRSSLSLPGPTGTASVVVVARTGEVVRLVPAARTLDDFRQELASLR
jgi:hypothetical protein